MAQGVSGAPAALEVHVTGRRVLATIVDGIVLTAGFWVMSALFGSTSVEGGQVGASLSGVAALASFVLVFAYYILLEGFLGQTLGKMLLGIKVVKEDTGEVPGLGAATIRTLLRIIDSLFFYLVAFVSVLASQKNKRLGDMVAHTLVVRK
ncbi:MAG TPA: RDD family protein [Rubrobacter sp.]|nr:RDD family protein [Rubrobacter sp.]